MKKLLLATLLLIFSCDEVLESIKEGCIHDIACNYDATATKDDESCTYPEGCNEWCEGDEGEPQELDCAEVCGGTNICGCNNATALNYDADATFNDDSCEYIYIDDVFLCADTCIHQATNITSILLSEDSCSTNTGSATINFTTN